MKTLIAATKNKGKLKELEAILGGIYKIVSMEDAGITLDIQETGSTFEENALIKAKAVCKITGLPAIADDSGLVVDALDGRPGIYSARYAARECALGAYACFDGGNTENGNTENGNTENGNAENGGEVNGENRQNRGKMTADKANNIKLVAEMTGIENRRARFVSAVALVESIEVGSVEKDNENKKDRRNLKAGNQKLTQNEQNSEEAGVCFIGYGETAGEILTEERGNNGFGYDPLFYSFDLKKSFGEASAQEKNEISHRYRALINLLEKL